MVLIWISYWCWNLASRCRGHTDFLNLTLFPIKFHCRLSVLSIHSWPDWWLCFHWSQVTIYSRIRIIEILVLINHSKHFTNSPKLCAGKTHVPNPLSNKVHKSFVLIGYNSDFVGKTHRSCIYSSVVTNRCRKLFLTVVVVSLCSHSNFKVWWIRNSVWQHWQSDIWRSHKLRKVCCLAPLQFSNLHHLCGSGSCLFMWRSYCVHFRSANGATSIFYGPLMMLKAACMHNPSYIDR